MPPFFVHLGMNNAFFHPKTPSCIECFAFNDKYVNCPEVVCHEFTHGFIENANPLGSAGEAGALNEAIADVVGIVFKRMRIMKKDWNMDGLRDLSETFNIKNLSELKPKYDHKGETTNDHGNVHHNSRLISHAFYLASTDLATNNVDPKDKQLLKIWWCAVLSLYDHEKTFNGFVRKTIQVAETEGRPIQEAIIKAWKQVGMI